jgi:hypothetical protein
MVISARPCSLDSAGGGVSTAGLLLQRCQRTEALRRCTLVLDLMDKAERSPRAISRPFSCLLTGCSALCFVIEAWRFSGA